VVAVEPGPGWNDPPIGICPRPDLGPHPEECPRIGPATLVLENGARLTVPAGTPGDPLLWNMAQAGDAAEEAFIVAGLQDEWTASWVYVLATGDLLGPVDLDAGAISLTDADGWAITASGWEYRLSGTLHTTGCAHLLPWTLGGPAPESDADWMTVGELLSIWDGPDGTRLDISPVGRATARTITTLTCTDLLDRRGDPNPLATLQTARDLWSAQSGGDYRFRWSSIGAQGRNGTWQITVADGEASGILVAAPSGIHEGQPFQAPTIDGLFADIRAALTAQPGDGPGLPCTDPRYWTARYEPSEGYPTSFAFDSPACHDEEQSWQVEWLQRLYEGLPVCPGWGAGPETGMPSLYSPDPIWQGGGWLEVGQTWRYEIPLDGCDFEFLHFNDMWWKQVSRTYTPGTNGLSPDLGADFAAHSYPDTWAVCVLPGVVATVVEAYGLITLVDEGTIEARSLGGDLIAVYAPTTEEPPCVTD
jgi:hypothetical protein